MGKGVGGGTGRDEGGTHEMKQQNYKHINLKIYTKSA